MNALNIQHIAVFSIEPFRFGIETSQIQEIQTVAVNRIIREFDDGSLIVQQHPSQAMLPVFHLRRCFALPAKPQATSPHALTCLIFRWQQQFAGCLIEKVENVIPAQFSALHPIPRVLTRIAKACHLWGFYTYADSLLPLIDLEHIIATPAIQETLSRCAAALQ